jgi:hypothetical protein
MIRNSKSVDVACMTAALSFLALGSSPLMAQTAPQEPEGNARVAGVVKPNLPPKKVIEYGWDTPYPAYVRDNIREMEKQPFDGVIFRLNDNADQVFNVSAWDKKKFESQLKVLSDIKWGKFTDNFLALYAASTMDWFSDSDWKTIIEHTKFCSKAAKTAGTVGFMFDPEPYGNNPWHYDEQKHAKTKTFAEYAAIARKRGAQFMKALGSDMPKAKILMFYQFSMPYVYASRNPDPVKRALDVNKSPYGLMAPFLDGMLEAAGPGIQFVDGNEFSYYYKSPVEFFRAYNMMRQSAKMYVAPELRDKFDRQVRAGQALYADYVFNTRPDIFKNNVAIGMTPEEQKKWFEHNTYYALQSSDEYVWLYSEQMDWWKKERLPAGIGESIVSAKRKNQAEEELGFDMAATMQAAKDRVDAESRKNLIRRTAHIARVAPGEAPTIDGILNDAIYQKTAPLEAFVGLPNGPAKAPELKAKTEARVLYDDQNLYITITSQEPMMNKIGAFGTTRDSSVWRGDSVEISISPDEKDSLFYHFILDPGNVQWDAIDKDTVPNLGFNPNWKSAVVRGANEWTVEASIPWRELNLEAPKPGSSLRANLARVRTPESELSSWSQFLGGFQEPQNFGTWIFD